LKNTTIDGRKIGLVYKEVSMPGVDLQNLPQGVSAAEVAQQLMRAEVGGAVLTSTPEVIINAARREATVVANSPFEASLIAAAAKRLTFPGHAGKVQSELRDMTDTGITLTFPASVDETAVLAALETAGVGCKSWQLDSGSSAFVAFTSSKQAVSAHESIMKNAIEALGGGDMRCVLSLTPAVTVEMTGLDPNTSVKTLTDAMSEQGVLDKGSIISTNRNAIVKFRRHKEVTEGMKLLKTLPIGEMSN